MSSSPDKTAVVTGASRGVGAAIARALGASGYRVALVARTKSALAQLASEIGNESFAIEADLSRPDAAEHAANEARSRFGMAPAVLVNNAGLFTIRGIAETPVEEFNSLLATNLTAGFVFVRTFLNEMKQRGSGHIVTIGSVADRHIFAGNAAYSATKYGARALHEVLRAETLGSGIRATLVSPAAVDTDIWEPIQFYETDARPDRSTMLDASAVAQAVLYAVSQPQDVNVDELRLSRS